MSARDGFTRTLETWLLEEGAIGTPDYADEVFTRTSSTRQRPAWLSPGRWLPMATTINARAYSVPRPARYGLLLILLTALTLAAVAAIAGSRQHRVPAPFGPAANGQVYFDVDGSIFAANADGSGRRALALGAMSAAGPYLSPDGTRLSFVVTDPSTAAGSEMWVVEADGSSPRKVSGDLRLDIDATTNPSWSPDSTQLVFEAAVAGSPGLFVANADGTGVRHLSDDAAAGGGYGWHHPEWSPSGTWIAFADGSNLADTAIAVIHPDGTGFKRLPTTPNAGEGFNAYEVWAPDLSNRIVYAAGATPDGQSDLIATIDVDAGDQTVISDIPDEEQYRPAWSPDGSRIAFDAETGVSVINADGSGLEVLPDRLALGPVRWSPDSTLIYGLAPDGLSLVAIDAAGAQPPTSIPFLGTATGLVSWQRTAP